VAADVTTQGDGAARRTAQQHDPHYKWGRAVQHHPPRVLMATINASIMLIALPNIFDGIALKPAAAEQRELSAVAHPRLPGDHRGTRGEPRPGRRHVRRGEDVQLRFPGLHRLLDLLSVTWMHGTAAAWWLIIMRILQGVGGAFLFANSSAILTDAFPENGAASRWASTPSPRSPGPSSELAAGRTARHGHLAPGLRRLGCLSALRPRVGLPQAPRHRHPTTRQDRLVGQHHLRRRPDRRYSSGSPTASSPTTGTTWAGPTRQS